MLVSCPDEIYTWAKMARLAALVEDYNEVVAKMIY